MGILLAKWWLSTEVDQQELSWMLVLKHFSCGLSIWWQQPELLMAERRDSLLIFPWKLSLVQSFPASRSLTCICSKTWFIFLYFLNFLSPTCREQEGAGYFFQETDTTLWEGPPFSPEQPSPVSLAAPQGWANRLLVPGWIHRFYPIFSKGDGRRGAIGQEPNGASTTWHAGAEKPEVFPLLHSVCF